MTLHKADEMAATTYLINNVELAKCHWITNNILDWTKEWDSRKIKYQNQEPISFYLNIQNNSIRLSDGEHTCEIDILVCLRKSQFLSTKSFDPLTWSARKEFIFALLTDALIKEMENSLNYADHIKATTKQVSFAKAIAQRLHIETELNEVPLTKSDYSKFISEHKLKKGGYF